MRPPKRTVFTSEELAVLAKLEEDTAALLVTRSECHYNTNVSEGTPHHLRDEVWDDFVRRANEAGYRAQRRGAVVTVKKPSL
jgi:hypothetical protein